MIVIDSSVLIAAERGAMDLDARLRQAHPQPAAMAAISASEILHGMHRASSEQRRARRLRFVEGLLERFPALPFDLAVARRHAAIWADLEREGIQIPPHDLMIAATAVQHGATVATRDKRSFPRIPDLNVLIWD